MSNGVKKSIIYQKLIPIIILHGAFILCAAVGMAINFNAFHKFISLQQLTQEVPPKLPHSSYYWDVEHYARMAQDLKCNAFYPLWPFIIHQLFSPQTLDQAAYYLRQLSVAIFAITIPSLFWVLKQSLSRWNLTLLVALAYTLNPMSIFQVIGYTETLFTALSIIFIWVCLPSFKIHEITKLSVLFLIISLMSLTRPILIQVILASVAALVTIFGFASIQRYQSSTQPEQIQLERSFSIKPYVRLTAVLCTAAIAGYSIYGLFCLHSRNDFFAPFSDQSNWGKQLELNLDLLLLPRSPLIDLLGLYFPIIAWAVAIVLVYRASTQSTAAIWVFKSPLWNILLLYPPAWILSYCFTAFRTSQGNSFFEKQMESHPIFPYTKTLSHNYILWFCIYFPLIQAAIVFVTQDRLNSLSRYTFAVPFFFLALGYVCRCLPKKHVYFMLWGLISISAIALIQQWILYGQNKWLG